MLQLCRCRCRHTATTKTAAAGCVLLLTHTAHGLQRHHIAKAAGCLLLWWNRDWDSTVSEAAVASCVFQLRLQAPISEAAVASRVFQLWFLKRLWTLGLLLLACCRHDALEAAVAATVLQLGSSTEAAVAAHTA